LPALQQHLASIAVVLISPIEVMHHASMAKQDQHELLSDRCDACLLCVMHDAGLAGLPGPSSAIADRTDSDEHYWT